MPGDLSVNLTPYRASERKGRFREHASGRLKPMNAQELPLRNIFLENLTEKLLFNFCHPQNNLFFMTNATMCWQIIE